MGEGFSGTSIKDTWTKPRGRVDTWEGGGFGWGGGRELGMGGMGRSGRGEMETIVLEQ